MNTDTKKTILSFHGGVGSVTGSNFLLAGERTKLFIDCGLIQGERFANEANREPFPYDPASVDFLLVTHAHIDHIGRIPKLVRDGFKGTIFSTAETKELTEIMLSDAFSLMRSECKDPEDMLYGEKDISSALAQWKTYPYREPFRVGEFEAMFKDAGHILGSAMIEISRGSTSKALERLNLENRGTQRKIVFTGDLGNSPSPLLRDTEAITDATYLVMESVYGDRNHEGLEERRQRLAQFINESAERGGALLIPCFSLEKTQALLYEMDELAEYKQIPSVPVFLDSPLAIKVTEVYRRRIENLNDAAKKKLARGDDIFKFPTLQLTGHPRDSEAIFRAPNPKIIIAGSGMSTGGRIIGHERRYLSDPASAILFVGYQAAGSLGRMIQEGVRKVTIENEEIAVRAKVETITGYSSHKDRDRLFDFVAQSTDTLEKVFVVMGEPRASLFLAQRIRDYLGVEAIVPKLGDSVEIEI